jgi:hypothetical protein
VKEGDRNECQDHVGELGDDQLRYQVDEKEGQGVDEQYSFPDHVSDCVTGRHKEIDQVMFAPQLFNALGPLFIH